MTERIYIGDIRNAGHCVRGARDWFRSNKLDWKHFLYFGIAIDDLPRDALSAAVIAHKREAARG